MRNRCTNPKNTSYKYYGARGIKVCKRWDDFTLFIADVGERPPCTTLDRIDNDGDYEPANVRWATSKTQAKNKRAPKGGWHTNLRKNGDRRWEGHTAVETKEMLARRRTREQAKAEGWFFKDRPFAGVKAIRRARTLELKKQRENTHV
jgi:hypothetical protein